MIRTIGKFRRHLLLDGMCFNSRHCSLGWFRGEPWGFKIEIMSYDPIMGTHTYFCFQFLKFVIAFGDWGD